MNHKRISRKALLMAVLLPIALTGCDDLMGLLADHEGSYTLTEINGQQLPYTLSYMDGDNWLVTDGGSATLSDGTYTSVANGRMSVSGNVTTWTENHTGTWEADGSSATFTQDNGMTAYATFESGDMIMDQNGNTLVFSKD